MNIDEVSAQVGNTPLIDLTPPGCASKIYAKAEYHNLSGSVKDRAALAMLQEGIENGQLTPGKTIIDATSGNTGIGLAVIGHLLGFPTTLVLPPQASFERLLILKAAQANLVFSDPISGPNGALEQVIKMYRQDPDKYFWPNQYYNPANYKAHFKTAQEVYDQTAGQVTHFLAAVGTGGTAVGVAQKLRKLKATALTLSVEPEEALHGIEGVRQMETESVPPLAMPDGSELLSIYAQQKHQLDGQLFVSTEQAYEGLNKLAALGYYVGVSAGANYMAALEVANQAPGRVVVTMLPDASDRYLSEHLWDPEHYGITIPFTLASQMSEYFEKSYPDEGCGLLVGHLDDHEKPVLEEFVALENKNYSRAKDRFQIDPLQYQQVEDRVTAAGKTLLGVVHSHPNCPPRPSETDLESAWPDMSYLIYSVYGGGTVSYKSWRLSGDKFQEELIRFVGERHDQLMFSI